MTEIDERHQVRMVDRVHRLRHLGRALPAPTRFHWRRDLEGDAHTIGLAEFGDFEQGFAFEFLETGTIENLVGTVGL